MDPIKTSAYVQSIPNNYQNTCYERSVESTKDLKNKLSLTKHQEYIATKKIFLTKTKRSFTELVVAHNESHSKDYNKHSILIYDSKGEACNFNGEVTDETLGAENYYECRHFALAVTEGVKPKVFSNISGIKNNSCLNDSKCRDLEFRIPKEGYYFNINNFFVVLKSILSACFQSSSNFIKSYHFNIYKHAMSLSIKKKSNILSIKFYDPNRTNIEKKIILLYPEDLDLLTLDNFFSAEAQELYFVKTSVALLSLELVTATSEARVNVFDEIDKIKLESLLRYGHYSKELSRKHNIIDNPEILSVKMGYIYVIVNKYYAVIVDYLNDLLESNNSIENKITAIFPYVDKNILNLISYSYIDGDYTICDIFLNTILINKSISSTEKVQIIHAMNADYPTLLLPTFFYKPGNNDKGFTKFINSILNTPYLNKTEKLSLLNCQHQKDMFWPYSFIENIHHLNFFITYLNLILASDQLLEQEKEQLINMNLSEIEKEELLYKRAINKHIHVFIINYIEIIITSNLSNSCKYRLLQITNQTYCDEIFSILEDNYPKTATLCIDLIPAYKEAWLNSYRKLLKK